MGHSIWLLALALMALLACSENDTKQSPTQVRSAWEPGVAVAVAKVELQGRLNDIRIPERSPAEAAACLSQQA